MEDPLKSYFVYESNRTYTIWSSEDFIDPIPFD